MAYSIWILEYARVPVQPVSSVLAGQHNKGTRELAFTYIAVVGEGRNILVDVGTNADDPYTQQLSARDSVELWQPPDKILAKIGLTPEEIDTVFLTHAHYDHMDNMDAFPNAHFYLQRRELEEWSKAARLDRKYSFVNLALNPANIENAAKLVHEGRMTLVDGEMKNVLPNIHLYPFYDGHSFASQAVIIDNAENGRIERWIAAGDVAYVRENITGMSGDGIYVPVGLGCGTQLNMMLAIDKIIELSGGNLRNILVGHETDNWGLFPSWQTNDGLHVAEVHLAPGVPSRRP